MFCQQQQQQVAFTYKCSLEGTWSEEVYLLEGDQRCTGARLSALVRVMLPGDRRDIYMLLTAGNYPRQTRNGKVHIP